eukprot:COSAG06_NODE_27713_length_588_cov_0.413088_1_plen_142_part_00
MLRILIGKVAAVAAAATTVAAAASGSAAPNVLYLISDDLRPEFGAYNQSAMVTTNVDRLAAEGKLFLRAYCQQAVCTASRASVLTGRRPDASDWGGEYWRTAATAGREHTDSHSLILTPHILTTAYESLKRACVTGLLQPG